jgi:hypothetical protein
MNMTAKPDTRQGCALKAVQNTISTCRSRWESNMRNAAYHRGLGNLKAGRSHVNQATFWRLQMEMSKRSECHLLAQEARLNAPDMTLSAAACEQSPATIGTNLLRDCVRLRTFVPYRDRKQGGVVRAAALLAADDAADRLLTVLHAAEFPDYFDDQTTRDEWAERVEDIVFELCDFAALAGESAADLLLEVAQIHRNNPDYAQAITEALTLLGRVANRRRAA